MHPHSVHGSYWSVHTSQESTSFTFFLFLINIYFVLHGIHVLPVAYMYNISVMYITMYYERTMIKPIFHCDAKYWRRGLALGNAPDARILRWRYQHVGIFWRYLTLKFAFSLTPNPDASQWNIGCVGSQRKILPLAMYISCFLCRFHLCLVPNTNPISSGIWTLVGPCISLAGSFITPCHKTSLGEISNLSLKGCMNVLCMSEMAY